MNIKKIISILTICLISAGVFSSEHVRLSLTKDLCTPRNVYLALPRVNPDEIDSLKNVIKFNYGDSIVELYSPPIMNQGSSQESCAGWAFGYGCASIQAYNKYQDWNWAKRSPSYLYNQVHDGTTCGPVKAYILLDSLVSQGVCSYYLMPYDETDCNTQPNSTQRADAALNKSLRLSLSDTTDISEYKQVLRMGHPVGVLTKYATDLQTLCATSSAHGVWTSIANTDTTKSHAICIVGFDDHQHLFKAMNSWGTNSGDNGFVWISYNLVENGILSEAYILEYRSNGFVPQIEGIETFSDTTAWYHIRNVPAGATITWSLTNVPNNYAGAWEFVIASSSNADSVRVAFRQIPANPGPGISSSDDPDYIRPIYKYADLTVTVSSGSTSYTTTKRIKRKVDSSPFALRSNMENNYLNISIQDSGNDILKNRENSYTYELWHTMYGLMKIQEIQNANEQVSTTGLPQGVYVVLLKENGTTSAQKKIMVK